MPLDFRYHLASLTAVFSALLIGILLGVAMINSAVLIDQVKQMREEYKKSQKADEIDQRTDLFNQRTQALLVHKRLLYRNVVLVCDGFVFPEDQMQAVRQTLQQAGATVTAEIILKPGLMQVAPERVKAMYQQIGISADGEPSVQDLLYRFGRDTGRGWTSITQVLEGEKLIRVSGDINMPISTVVYLGGSITSPEDPLNTIDFPFLRACVERRLHIAAAEEFDEKRPSVMSDYQKYAPIAIDNINKAAGRIALVLALSANRQGHFGYRPNADDVAPDIE